MSDREIVKSTDEPMDSESEPIPEIEEKIAVSELEELQIQLADLQSLADERFEQLLRCRADLENLIKRTTKEREEYARYASEKLICKLLSILDSLEQAQKHDDGSKVLFQQLQDILENEGLVAIEAVGHKFDPYMHEALFQVKSEELDEDLVVQEIQKGYMLNSKVIRFSKVAVSKK
jgi:molecular chaperone GrpE